MLQFPAPEPETLDSQGARPPDVEELMRFVEQMYLYARGQKAVYQERIARWRKFFDLAPPAPPYEGALSAAVPLIRQKVDGIRANIKLTLDRKPFFTARPLTSGAADVAPVLESVMEWELTKSGSKAAIEQAVDDAVLHGTGILKLGVDWTGQEPRIVVERAPIQNVFAWPTTVHYRKATWFYTYYQPWWEMKRLAQLGEYDEAVVDSLRGYSISDDGADPEQTVIYASTHVFPEQAWFKIIETWTVWNGELTRVVWSYADRRRPLKVEVDPLGGVLDYPPFYPVVIDPDPVELWGHGIAEVLEGHQLVADAAVNFELWNAQYKLSPPVLVRANSQTHKQLQEAQKILPGQIYTYDGDLTAEEAIAFLKTEPNPFNYTILQLMEKLTEEATIPDHIIPGLPLGGRRTAAEVRLTMTIGQIKLANYLRHVKNSLEALAEDYWKLIAYIKIPNAAHPGLPQGIYRAYAYDGQKGKRYVATRDIDLVLGDAQGVPRRIRIPSAQRDDIVWVVTGDATVAERENRQQAIMALINPAILQLVQIARQDPGIYKLMRRFFEALGMGYDAEAILGPEPEAPTPAQAVLQGFLGQMLGGGREPRGSAEPAEQGSTEGSPEGP